MGGFSRATLFIDLGQICAIFIRGTPFTGHIRGIVKLPAS
jgi:hypothetical protein